MLMQDNAGPTDPAGCVARFMDVLRFLDTAITDHPRAMAFSLAAVGIDEAIAILQRVETEDAGR